MLEERSSAEPGNLVPTRNKWTFSPLPATSYIKDLSRWRHIGFEVFLAGTGKPISKSWSTPKVIARLEQPGLAFPGLLVHVMSMVPRLLSDDVQFAALLFHYLKVSG